MTKLNWQKLNQRSKDQSFKERAESSYSRSSFYKDNNIWHLRGKYQGIHVQKLPLDYLGWIIDNFKGSEQRQYYEIAESELYRRYRELSNT